MQREAISLEMSFCSLLQTPVYYICPSVVLQTLFEDQTGEELFLSLLSGGGQNLSMKVAVLLSFKCGFATEISSLET